MLKLIGLLIKMVLFSAVVLVLGNWIQWRGKTISDQIKTGMAHAEETGVLDHFRTWTDKLTRDAKRGFQRKINRSSFEHLSIDERVSMDEQIPASEKQKLKALIRELNSSHKND